jgi:uroporphyrinogen-III synthase
MYRTVSNDFTEDEVKAFDYDMCVFFSPSGINAFTKTFGTSKNEIAVATFGPSTTKSAHEAGLNVVIEAPSEKFPSMTGALQHYLLMNEED